MTPNEPNRGIPREIRRGLLAGLLLALCFIGACAHVPVVVKPRDQVTVDRRNVEYPAGFDLKLVMTNLNAPSAVAFDADGTMLIAETGVDGQEPRILAVKPDLTLTTVYPTAQRIPFSPFQPGFQIYGPIGGMVVDHHKIYVSHRDRDDRGMITQFGYDGSHRIIQGALPTEGDYGVTDLIVVNGRLYFGVGSATNSGVVGLDNLRWLRKHRDFCDQSYQDLELLGLRFNTKNPFAGLFSGSETVNTGPFQIFGVSNLARISKSLTGKPNSAVCSVALTGGDFHVEAFGIRYPRGLAADEFNALYVSNDGMEMRGSRPVKDDPDVIVRLPSLGGLPMWFGFPDFTSDMKPVTDKLFQPPVELLARTGFPKLAFLIDHIASELHPPDPSILLKAQVQPLSGLAKMEFPPQNSPFSRYRRNLFAAESGDRYPFATSGYDLKAPVGYKVVRVNVDNGKVEDFIRNTQVVPASRQRGGVLALERPIDVKIGPDGAMYVLDFGQIEYKQSGRQKVARGTGKLFKLIASTQPATQP